MNRARSILRGFLNRFEYGSPGTHDDGDDYSHRDPSFAGDKEDDYSADAPLQDPTDDLLGRWEFSKRIAASIARRIEKSGLVIAVNGEWGEGKTTVLNFIDKALGEFDDVIVYRFNPWRFPSEPELLISFFLGLADAVGRTLPNVKERIGDWVKEYLSGIGALLGRGEAVEKIGDLLSSVRLEELKERVGEILQEEGKSVVVLMDDIDRLEKSEIHSIFRLVKLSASFRNVVYVLAFDDDLVADAIQERYGTRNPDAGRNFIEKIVQVPLSLPASDSLLLRSLCFQGVDKALNSSGVQLEEEEVTRFVTGFVNGIEIRLNTPRMAKRYSNILMFSLPLVRGEVDHVDFLHVEAVRVFYPEAYEVLRNNRDLFVGRNLAGHRLPSEPERSRAREIIDLTYQGLTNEERDSLQYILGSLFPRLQTIYGNTVYGSEWDSTWAEDKRIAAQDYVERYFTFSVPLGDVPDQIIDSFIDDLQTIDVADGTQQILGFLTSQTAEKIINKLRLRIEHFDEDLSTKLARIIAKVADRFPNPEQMFSFNAPYERAAMFVARLAERVDPSGNNRDIFLSNIVAESEPIGFAAHVLRWLRTDETRLAHPFTQENKENAANNLINRLREITAEGKWLFEINPDDAPLLISIWSRYGNIDEVNSHIDLYLTSIDGAVNTILASYIPMAYPLGGGTPHKSDFERDEYNSLAHAMDPELIVTQLGKQYGDQLNSDEYPRFSSDSIELLHAQQFLWIHNFVLNEQEQLDENLPESSTE